MKTTHLISMLMTIMFLSACANTETVTPAPTAVDVNALKTAAVQTVVANITQTAGAQPTLAATETLIPEAVIPIETAIPTPTASPSLQLCDDSAFISDASVPDGTQVIAGQAFVKTWMVKNTGSCSWKTSYQIIYAYGEKMGGLPAVLPTEVPPGSQVEISINLKAPLKAGNYGGYWRLANNNRVPFGQIFTVIIVVP